MAMVMTIASTQQREQQDLKVELKAETEAEIAEGKADEKEKRVWRRRAEEIREATRSAYRAYMEHGEGLDDLDPVKKRGVASDIHARATLFDSLSTLWVTGLRDEFSEAVVLIRREGGGSTGVLHSGKTFEYHIRVVGGLLSAYALSGEGVLLQAATEAADGVLGALSLSRTSIPVPHARMLPLGRQPIRWAVGRAIDEARFRLDPDGMLCNSLAGVGSLGLELRWLSRETGDPCYREAAEKIAAAVESEWRRSRERGGVWVKRVWATAEAGYHGNERGCGGGVTARLGTGGDSYYEYLLKEHLLFPEDPDAARRFRDMYPLLAKRAHAEFFDPRGYSHFACFSPGMLALGSRLLPDAPLQMQRAEQMLEYCLQRYNGTLTGLAPDDARDAAFPLRPETVESLFVLWRTTGRPVYRQAAWRIWKAVRRHCRVADSGGFSGLLNVHEVPSGWDGVQPSYFISEMLKYLYLTFDDDSQAPLLPLSDFVFTTEGHPLPIASPRCPAPGCTPRPWLWALWDGWLLEWLFLLSLPYFLFKLSRCCCRCWGHCCFCRHRRNQQAN